MTFLILASLFIWILYLSSDVNKLKKQVRLLSTNESSYVPLSLNIGNSVIFEFHDEPIDLDLYNQACIILDIDTNWVRVQHVTSKKMYMINLDLIKGFQINK